MNSFSSPKHYKGENLNSPFRPIKIEDQGMLISGKNNFQETFDDYDRMQHFKFYFVNNNYEKVLKKMKRRFTPLKKSRISQQKGSMGAVKPGIESKLHQIH